MKEEMLIAGIQKPGRQERGHIHYNKVARMFHSGMSNESPKGTLWRYHHPPEVDAGAIKGRVAVRILDQQP